MKRYLTMVGIMSAILPAICNAASVIIFDEGINTEQDWDAKNVTERFQVCSSLGTIYSINGGGQPPTFDYLSLCKDEFQIQVDEDGASEYQNNKDYTVGAQTYEYEIFDEDYTGLKRGIHGNVVSDALYSFDKSVVHRPMQVFGIELGDDDSKRWRTSYIIPGASYDELVAAGEPPGWNIIRLLDYISRGSDASGSGFNQLTDLGAITISIVLKGGFADRLCTDQRGGISVNRLRDRGIPVVVALANEDIPINQKTWPACLNNVIAVGGLTSLGLGVGANNMTFFAKDTVGRDNGNSLAAPRVATAYALLHERFPTSTLSQKFDALRAANPLRTRRTTIGNVDTPVYRKEKYG